MIEHGTPVPNSPRIGPEWLPAWFVECGTDGRYKVRSVGTGEGGHRLTVAVTVKVKLGEAGDYYFQHQLASQPEPQRSDRNGNGQPAEGGRLVPQTSSVIAPGYARRIRA